MAVMTFVGKTFAKKGLKYYFEEVNPNCPESCNLFATCQKNLMPKTLYEIVKVTEKTFTCPKAFHEEEMVLVELAEPKLKVSMFNKDIYEGSVTSFAPVECDRDDCQYIDFCAPQTLMIQAGEKIKILTSLKKIKDCPRDLHISLIEIEKKGET